MGQCLAILCFGGSWGCGEVIVTPGDVGAFTHTGVPPRRIAGVDAILLLDCLAGHRPGPSVR